MVRSQRSRSLPELPTCNEPAPTPGAAMARFMQQDTQRRTKLVRETDLKIEA